MTSDAIRTEVYQKSVHAGYADIARELNIRFPERPLHVTRQQAHVWFTRRDRNRFPRPYPVLVPSGKIKKLFHLNEVIDWYTTYTSGQVHRKKSPAVDNTSETG